MTSLSIFFEISSNLNFKLPRFIKRVFENITGKHEKIFKPQREFYNLTTKVNELERCSSESSDSNLIFLLLSGNSLVEDVMQSMQKVLQIQVNQTDFIEFRFLKPYNTTADPSPVTVNFVTLFKKDIAWA